MTATFYRTEDAEVTISDEAYRRYANDQSCPAFEQHMNHATSIQTAIFAGSAIGLIVTFAALVIIKIHGA